MKCLIVLGEADLLTSPSAPKSPLLIKNLTSHFGRENFLFPVLLRPRNVIVLGVLFVC